MKRRKSKITLEQKNEADIQIREMQKEIKYDTKDYTVELLVEKFNKQEFFIPDYQRNYIWKEKNKSLFIESVLLGLPIPFMFFGKCENGTIEIIDGAQRIQTLQSFLNNHLKLTNLKKLNKINGFYYEDLPEPQKLKFKDITLRVITLEENTSNEVRQDLFNRINTTGMKANDSEIRRGSYPGALTSFIEECTRDERFIRLCPVSEKGESRYERFELVLRFFAYVNNYNSFVHDVNVFLDTFLKENLETFDRDLFIKDFNSTMEFVEKNLPNGFAKTKTAKTTPRVRFEAIAVGIALALREQPDLKVNNVDWLESEKFAELTTSDASNNQGKLQGRIEFVRDELLQEI
jgi:hypothetical protein